MSEDARLIFNIFTANQAMPIENATVCVTSSWWGSFYKVNTDVDGHTKELLFSAPDKSISLDSQRENYPYTRCNARIVAEGYKTVKIYGIQVFSQEIAIQPVELIPSSVHGDNFDNSETFSIPKNALEKTYEDQQYFSNMESRVLREPIIPEYITVHLGRPDNTSARNVSVSFPDYIKNVASSEIYPTWPENSLKANIYAEISVALNRVYTEWYRSRGYNFDITNSTAFDQYFVYGRNIFENISKIVDEIFNTFIIKSNTINPYYAEYCNGTTVTCKGMSQWGTVDLANKGYTPIKILRYYYNNDTELTTTNKIEVISTTYPGAPLKIGSISDDVIIISNYLNRIRKNYPNIPEIYNVSKNFTAQVESSVKIFQKIFNLTQDGIVGKSTWNKISYIYVAVKKLAELGSEGETIILPETPPSYIIMINSTGDYVKIAQYMLKVISNYDFQIPPITIDGVFGNQTLQAVLAFQRENNLVTDGIVGEKTWTKLYSVYLGITNTTGLALKYPGHVLKEGSSGTNVEIMQNYLNRIAKYQPAIPTISADGKFGSKTKTAVWAFQNLYNLTDDGVIGKITWDKIISVRLLY